MKLVKEYINEVFKEESDPINDLEIGIKGTVYRCGNCGSLVDANGYALSEEEFERSKIIIDKFGDKYMVDIWCIRCQEEEYENARYEEEEREREREEENRRYEEEEREREREEEQERYRRW